MIGCWEYFRRLNATLHFAYENCKNNQGKILNGRGSIFMVSSSSKDMLQKTPKKEKVVTAEYNRWCYQGVTLHIRHRRSGRAFLCERNKNKLRLIYQSLSLHNTSRLCAFKRTQWVTHTYLLSSSVSPSNKTDVCLHSVATVIADVVSELTWAHSCFPLCACSFHSAPLSLSFPFCLFEATGRRQRKVVINTASYMYPLFPPAVSSCSPIKFW